MMGFQRERERDLRGFDASRVSEAEVGLSESVSHESTFARAKGCYS